MPVAWLIGCKQEGCSRINEQNYYRVTSEGASNGCVETNPNPKAGALAWARGSSATRAPKHIVAWRLTPSHVSLIRLSRGTTRSTA